MWPPTDKQIRGETQCNLETMTFPVLWGFKMCPGSSTELCSSVAGGGRMIKTITVGDKTQINWNDPVYGNDRDWKLKLQDGKIVGKFWLFPFWIPGATFHPKK